MTNKACKLFEHGYIIFLFVLENSKASVEEDVKSLLDEDEGGKTVKFFELQDLGEGQKSRTDQHERGQRFENKRGEERATNQEECKVMNRELISAEVGDNQRMREKRKGKVLSNEK